jgi:hypothetical protein
MRDQGRGMRDQGAMGNLECRVLNDEGDVR